MTSTLKNVLIGIICLIIASLGYFLYMDSVSSLPISSDPGAREELIAKTEKFLEHSSQLQQVALDQSIFTDEVFVSLTSFTTEVPDQSIGRENIFEKSQSTYVVSDQN